MAEFKKNILTMTIGGLVTAIGLVSNIGDMLFGPAQTTVGYVAQVVQVPQTTADAWWWSLLSWFPILLLYGAMLCGVVIVVAAVRNPGVFGKGHKREKITEREHKLTEQLKFQQRIASGAAQGTLVAKPVEWLTLQQAVNRSKGEKWILGQGIEQQLDKSKAHIAGELFTVNPNSHFAILGATRSGKTKSAAFHLVLLAKVNKWHVIVLDGKGGIDWRKYDGAVEWHDLTPENLKHYAGEVTRIYKSRQRELLAANAGEFSELPAHQRPPRILVIFEEFGSTWVGAERDEEVDGAMDELFRRSCATGIHICLVDQAPQLWSRQMATNAAVALCFRAKGQTLNAFGGYHCGNLKVGEFCDDTSIYKSWFVAGEDVNGIPLMQCLSKQSTRLLQGPGVAKNGRVTNDDCKPPFEDSLNTNAVSNASNGGLQVVQTVSNASNPQTFEIPATPVAPPSMVRAFERLKRWDEPSKIFFQMYPKATQADLRTVMASIDGKQADAYKAEAFKWFHVYSPQGNPAKLVGKFGMTQSSVQELVN